MTGVGLSLGAGLSRPAVLNIEKHKRVPGLHVVEKLARGLGCSPCLLAYGVEAPYRTADTDAPLRCAGIGERLVRARETAAISKNALGIAAQTTGQTIANIENGQIPSVAIAEQLANALRVSPCWLAFAEGEPSGPRFPPPIKKKRSLAPRRITRTSARRGR